MADFDLAIIGGGLNGTLIARDAAGRGLRVVLIEQNDLGGHAPRTPARIEGGFAEIERGAVFAARRALAERAIWLRIAPHLVTPVQMAMPAHARGRTPLGIRTVLAVHDRLSPRDGLPRATTLDVTHHPVGVPLQRPFGTAFAWTECLADTARIAALSALDAAEHGASIMTGARCVRADRSSVWTLAVIDRGRRRSLTARALVNAAGAWIPSVAETVLRLPARGIRLMASSRIVVSRRFDHDGVYALQGPGRTLVFLASLRDNATTIGAIEGPFAGDPAIAMPSASDVEKLCRVVNDHLREAVEPADIIRAEARAYPVATGGRARDGLVRLNAKRRLAPLLTVFGDDVTMSRHRAERAVDRLIPFYPMSRRWTANHPLPGGDLRLTDIDDLIDEARYRWRFLDASEARRLVAAYGTRLDRVLGDASHRDDLGPWFGDRLSAAEVRYLMRHEWARFPDDVLWRRSLLGPALDADAQAALAAFMAASHAASVEPTRSGG